MIVLSSGDKLTTCGACLSTLNVSVALATLLDVSSKHLTLQLCFPTEIPNILTLSTALLFANIFVKLTFPSRKMVQFKTGWILSSGLYEKVIGLMLTKISFIGLIKV